MELFYCWDPTILIFPKTYEKERVFIIETNAGKEPIIIRDVNLLKALSSIRFERFTKGDVKKIFKANSISSEDEIKLLWQLFRDRKIFLTETELKKYYPKYQSWKKYNWGIAFKYQQSTQDYPFVFMDDPSAFEIDNDRMAGYFKKIPPPARYQDFHYLNTVSLKKFSAKDDLNEYFSNLSPNKKQELEGLSLLFDISFGERNALEFQSQGTFLKKAIPSGGARHPTEVFFISFDFHRVEPGIYHYNVEKNILGLLTKGNFKDQCGRATFDLFKKFPTEPKGLLIFTTLFERAMWRYRESRSWRAPLVDIGHAAILYQHIASTLNFQTYTEQKFDDSIITDLLKLDAIRQTPLLVASLV